jgi:hypothetical protein
VLDICSVIYKLQVEMAFENEVDGHSSELMMWGRRFLVSVSPVSC